MTGLTLTHFDNRKQSLETQYSNMKGEERHTYLIPELIPIHTFSLDRDDPFVETNPTPPSYARLQPVETSNIATVPSNHYKPPMGPYDSLKPEVEESYVTAVPPIPGPYPGNSDLSCVMGTHLASGLDISSISNELKLLLNYICPFYDVPLGLTELIIFGRRLNDVHVLIKDQHVSGQQFILKFILQSGSYRLIVLNHGNQNIKLTSMCGTHSKILEKTEHYEFNSDDDIWLSILGINDVMWRITVRGKVHNKETVTRFTLENKYFDRSLYASAMRKENCIFPLPLPGNVNINPPF